MKDVRVRFAPSPTGYLHIGSLRTALYDYLFAKKNKGSYILRLEDTDQGRFVEDAARNLVDWLRWAGVEHDEGLFFDENGKAYEKGEYGPYIQSKRLDIYKEHIDKLLKSGDAYYCFCDKERLNKVREIQKQNGETPKYDGHCRELSKEEIEKNLKEGKPYVIRLKLPLDTDIVFKDAIRGEITVNTRDLDDQVLMKSDGFPTYHFAAIVDDHLMKISHVFRGEEWLPSAPKNIYTFKVLGWEAPEYVHLPTVLNKDRKKLSKRQGDVSVEDFAKQGYLKEGLVNYLALVGWSPDSNQEIFNMEELIEAFSLNRLSNTGGIFDREKLNWVNGQHIKKMDVNELTNLAKPYLLEGGLLKEDNYDDNYAKLLVQTVQEKIAVLSEIQGQVEFLLNDDLTFENEETKQIFEGETIPLLMETFKKHVLEQEVLSHEFCKGIFKVIQKETGIKGKNLYMPLRAMVTGQLHGPDLGAIFELLGKEKIIKRIDYCQKMFL